jgi:hypothetical protein
MVVGRLTHSRAWTIASAPDYLGSSPDAQGAEGPMQLAPMRYTRIDGTSVAVSVTSATEAKAAVKELRHKKRELKFLRAALVRQQRALRPKQRGGRRGAERSPSLSRAMIDGLGGLIGGLFDHATTAARGGRRSLADIEREIRQLDETLHNIEGCILQLQGKLLTKG